MKDLGLHPFFGNNDVDRHPGLHVVLPPTSSLASESRKRYSVLVFKTMVSSETHAFT